MRWRAVTVGCDAASTITSMLHPYITPPCPTWKADALESRGKLQKNLQEVLPTRQIW